MKWLDLSSEERDAALNTVSQQLDIDTPSVEISVRTMLI